MRARVKCCEVLTSDVLAQQSLAVCTAGANCIRATSFYTEAKFSVAYATCVASVFRVTRTKAFTINKPPARPFFALFR